jgi:hypothetical protein
MFRFLVYALILGLSSLASIGCQTKDAEKLPLAVDPAYSVNVVQVPEYWPREEIDWPALEPSRSLHQEAHDLHGEPDFIRLVYTFDNRFVRPIELEEKHIMSARRPAPLTEWVYIDQEKVIRFEGTRFVEDKISDELRMICLHGDPTQFHEAKESDGTIRRTYTYLNLGKEFTFYDGVLANTRDFSAAHGYQIRN